MLSVLAHEWQRIVADLFGSQSTLVLSTSMVTHFPLNITLEIFVQELTTYLR